MEKKAKTLARRLTNKILIWTILVVLGLSYVILHFETEATRQFYSEIYYNKMLITKEYTRRVISDVYVAATNNIYYLEHSLDKPDGHKQIMERIVKSGTRVRSCGISFIEDYYFPEKEHHFCPFAWRNVAKPDVVYSQDLGDADLDYLNADWFKDVVESDSARWSDPFYDTYDEKTALSAYMVPIHDLTGKVVAVMGADMSLDWLTNKLSETDSTINKNTMMMASLFEMKSQSFIINHDGTFMTNSDENRIIKDNFFTQLEGTDGSEAEQLINMMKAADADEAVQKSLERYLVNGVECYVFYTPVKYTQWILVTVVPCHAIDILCYLNAVTVLAIILLAILLLVIVTYYYIRNATEPIKQLVNVTNDIAQGKYDTPLPEITHKDELADLRDSIQKMQFNLSENV